MTILDGTLSSGAVGRCRGSRSGRVWLRRCGRMRAGKRPAGIPTSHVVRVTVGRTTLAFVRLVHTGGLRSRPRVLSRGCNPGGVAPPIVSIVNRKGKSYDATCCFGYRCYGWNRYGHLPGTGQGRSQGSCCLPSAVRQAGRVGQGHGRRWLSTTSSVLPATSPTMIHALLWLRKLKPRRVRLTFWSTVRESLVTRCLHAWNWRNGMP